MKRSEINALIEHASVFFAKTGFVLPPFAHWTPEDWQRVGKEADEIRENSLGWDVTDYGLGEFFKTGLLLFTLRNGNYNRPDQYPKGYAEKIMVVREKQITPWHYHWKKREDIINRGGGNLVIEMFLTTENNTFADKHFDVSVDAVKRTIVPGGSVVLAPGESICLEPFVFHTFYGQEGKGDVVVGEVSDVNDDENDNCFFQELGRFPQIEEDVRPLRYLCNEYPAPV